MVIVSFYRLRVVALARKIVIKARLVSIGQLRCVITTQAQVHFAFTTDTNSQSLSNVT